MKEVLKKIKPEKEEKEKLSETSEELIKRAREASSELDLSIEPKLVGSAARGTWLSGERDIDLFLLFPENVSRKELEKNGLKIGKSIAEGEGREQYAEHPYINSEINGFDIDIVPCYDIKDPSKLKSAVDRSPHHQEYIKGWLTPERRDQVRLLKKFLKGIEVYGSELETHGFSGYLSELLIAHYSSFSELIQSANGWGEEKILAPGDERDKEDIRKLFPDQPLVFIDPVDPGRNVAAAVSKKNYATFIRASQSFMEDPRKKFFFPNEPKTSTKHLRKLIESRKTSIYMISFEITFDLVSDIIYPQLQKTKKTLERKLENLDFEVLRSGVWSDEENGIILLELKVPELPRVKRHIGPPLGIDAEPFIQEHLDSEEKFAGPYINREGRLVFELERKNPRAEEVLRGAIDSPEGFGKHVEKSLQKGGYEITKGQKIVEKAEDMNAQKFLARYLTRCLPWYR